MTSSSPGTAEIVRALVPEAVQVVVGLLDVGVLLNAAGAQRYLEHGGSGLLLVGGEEVGQRRPA